MKTRGSASSQLIRYVDVCSRATYVCDSARLSLSRSRIEGESII